MTLPVEVNPLMLGGGGYQIPYSLRFRSSASAYLSRTPGSAGNRQKWTWSGWVKLGELSVNRGLFSATNSSDSDRITIASDNKLYFYWQDGIQGTATTNSVLRDASAWYHIVVTHDTTQSTASNRLKIYLNNIEQSKSTDSPPAQNHNGAINNTVLHTISRLDTRALQYFDGYLAEVNFIDGAAKLPSDFGETDPVTGVWKPKKYTGAYGTNGFYLPFNDPASTTTIGYDRQLGLSDSSKNNWTANNISVTSGETYDSMIDTPTPYADGGNGRGNYATLNPISPLASGSISNANLTFTSGNADTICLSNFGVSSGKWYWETTVSTVSAAAAAVGFIGQPPASIIVDLRASSNGYCYMSGGTKGNNNVASAYGATYTSGDIIGVALDLDNGAVYFSKNNTWQNSGDPTSGATKTGAAYTGLSGVFSPAYSDLSGASAGSVFDTNFGQRPFTYTPPSGFKALNTQNLPDPTIKAGNKYFDATIWTGNASYPRSITNSSGFQPDLVWMKARSSAYDNLLIDAVRGTGNAKMLVSNLTSAEGEDSANANLTSFNSNGFTLSAPSGTDCQNANGLTMVAWQWKESASSGFDIVTGTSTGTTGTITIPHNLGISPSMVLCKNISISDDWYSWHIGLGASSDGYYVALSTTGASNISSGIWGTGFTSSNLYIGQNAFFSASGQSIICYTFSEIPGFSKFGSYTGNGSTDGVFVYTGFRPRYLLLKITSAGGGSWQVKDTSIDTYNAATTTLYPNLSNAEGSDTAVDLLSNGFKLRASTGENASGATVVYAAFAENPFKYSLAR